MKADSRFWVYFSGKEHYMPRFAPGDFVKRRGEAISGKVKGWTFYAGLKSFAYWIEGYGNDIPEDQLYKPRKRK